MVSVAVVTATTGRDSLVDCVESVWKQTYPCKHYVFADGRETIFEPKANMLNLQNLCMLPVKTGGNGVMNGGIVAASAYLVQEDMICWLDDDNTFEPNHIEELVNAKQDKPVAHSLRRLLNPDGSFYDYDDFESLGRYSGFIDLNCFLMDRRMACGISTLWYNTTGELMVGDRYVSKWIFDNSVPLGESGKYTVNYMLNPKRDLRSWFFDGNIKNRAKYSGDLPWRAK
jgi:glycosyltransferase involved in cell wall biosynthesis